MTFYGMSYFNYPYVLMLMILTNSCRSTNYVVWWSGILLQPRTYNAYPISATKYNSWVILLCHWIYWNSAVMIVLYQQTVICNVNNWSWPAICNMLYQLLLWLFLSSSGYCYISYCYCIISAIDLYQLLLWLIMQAIVICCCYVN